MKVTRDNERLFKVNRETNDGEVKKVRVLKINESALKKMTGILLKNGSQDKMRDYFALAKVTLVKMIHKTNLNISKIG